MIKQVFNIEHYWKVIVYYDIDYNLFDDIYDELYNADISTKQIYRVYRNMLSNKAKAVTVSNINKNISIVLFNKHKNNKDYINSIVHEAEHIKQHILHKYHVKDSGEEPAYTIGYIAMNMFDVFIDDVLR